MCGNMARFGSTLRFPTRRQLGSWLLPALVMLCPACSGGLVSVKGKVLCNGAPVKNAVVSFHLKGENAVNAINPTGMTDENGEFILKTQSDTGAAAGEYLVTILWLDEPPAASPAYGMPEGKSKRTDRLKGRYSNPDTSGLTAVIKSDTKELEPFNLAKVD
jgi:hypothetical protein